MSKEDTLLWLQSQRDIGIFIQCCRKSCKKWRYCDDFHDPVDVPKLWYCKMNSNKAIASCFVPEVPKMEAVEEDLIENKYNCGSLVWAHMHNYLWWPAIVDDCPENLRYYELKESSIIPVKYHVTFFKDDIIQHAWLNPRSIKAFVKYKKGTIMKKNKFYKMNDKKSLEKAYTLAQSAIPLSIFERLQRFSYISRLKNMRESVNQFDEEEDNEIPPTPPLKRITLKEFCLKNRHYTENKFL
ncbi:PREDICTED: zinc finger CW-type PWWP domain protein 1-like [Atta cephalotes]|uniref:PWWP domain-containing protein n=1 Tax=Atta cephalotes TaxID=12957 RepID=A0A158NZ49_ATTCE|nr:PREDICTED: zinc finger CW-type PWWP domain protein 1-like [Atta cephalotes]